MFDELVKDFEKIGFRAKLAARALEISKKEDSTSKSIQSVQATLPTMQVSIDLQPVFDTPEEAIEASKDKDKILMESFKKNLSQYVIEGI